MKLESQFILFAAVQLGQSALVPQAMAEQESRKAFETRLAREELEKMKSSDQQANEQIGSFFLYVVLPVVALFMVVGVARSR